MVIKDDARPAIKYFTANLKSGGYAPAFSVNGIKQGE
jgi:hypothetical protein